MLGKRRNAEVHRQARGEVDSLKKMGTEKLTPITGETQKAVEALKDRRHQGPSRSPSTRSSRT